MGKVSTVMAVFRYQARMPLLQFLLCIITLHFVVVLLAQCILADKNSTISRSPLPITAQSKTPCVLSSMVSILAPF